MAMMNMGAGPRERKRERERWRGEWWRGGEVRGGEVERREARGREYKERAFGGESLCNKLPSFHMPPRDTTKDEKAMSPTSNTVELEITIPEGSNPGDILSVEVNGEMLEAPWASLSTEKNVSKSFKNRLLVSFALITRDCLSLLLGTATSTIFIHFPPRSRLKVQGPCKDHVTI